MDKIMEKLNKLSLPAVILVASVILGGFYFASQIAKQMSIEKQQQITIEQEKQEQLVKELNEQQAKEEAERKARLNTLLLDACFEDARANYEANWANSCKIEAQEISTGYQNCINSGSSASICKSIWGTADASADCSLPTATAQRWDETHQKARDECFKKYPQ